MDNITMPVTIVVKAPNQQIEDQTVICELNWTIKRLKGHLSEVYPSKPRLEDQKLIYSGQLLVDTVQLKDVLRTYDGQENHTVHLVCSPPRDNLKKSPSSKTSVQNNSSNINSLSSADTYVAARSSLSNNSVTTNGSETFLPATDEMSTSRDPQEMWSPATVGSVYPNLGTFSSSNAANQLAWMQQAYSQYINSYIQYLSSNQNGDGNNAARLFYQSFSGYIPPGAAPYNYQQLPPYNVPPQQQQPQQQPNVAAANNQQPQQDNDDDEGRVHRDWLDWFYIMTRVLVLFSIVYFYSSPIRFLMVSTLGMIMYMYQVGFFRMQGLDGRNEAGGNRIIANNAAGPAERENNNDQPNAAAAAAAAAADEPSDGSNTGDAANSAEADVDVIPPEPDRPSFLSLTWTILCSFLLSLIPEQPNVI